MNTRRGFLSQIIQAGVSAMILPSAVTYGRKWVKPIPANGRRLWTIDWSDLECVIIDPAAPFTLKAHRWTALVEAPPIIENFSMSPEQYAREYEGRWVNEV
jgi:hypothetical protein